MSPTVKSVITCLLCCGALLLSAQGTPSVSFAYQDMPLEEALSDLENRYALNFTYISDHLPMDYELSARAEAKTVPDAMNTLFAETPIRHALIGNQIVLRADAEALKKLETKVKVPRQKTPLYQEPQPRPTPPPSPQLSKEEKLQISGGDQLDPSQFPEEDWERLSAAMQEYEQQQEKKEYDETHRLAQISLLPYLGTNTHRSDQITNNLSVNVVWGTSRAIDGLEVGGVANTVIEDMRGAQFAGVANMVGGQVIGTQISGGVNIVEGKVTGTQMAGAANITRDSVIGVQMAGLFNKADHHVNGTQVAGGWNWANGDVRQQMSPFFNKARYVEKRQIGLINICDSTQEASYGLLNIVKYGYNRVEVGTSEALFVNLAAKLGTRRLYNIFQLGMRWDMLQTTVDGIENEAVYTSWALGYGFGAAHQLGSKTQMHTEIVAMHVNELETWTNDLNLLGQVRINFDYRFNRRMSFYAGPVLNMMWSRLYDPLKETYGSRLPVNPLWNEQDGATNFQGWVGFSAGMRF